MTPYFVSHHGLEKTVFFFKDGSQEAAQGYCYWLNGRAVRWF